VWILAATDHCGYLGWGGGMATRVTLGLDCDSKAFTMAITHWTVHTGCHKVTRSMSWHYGELGCKAGLHAWFSRLGLPKTIPVG